MILTAFGTRLSDSVELASHAATRWRSLLLRSMTPPPGTPTRRCRGGSWTRPGYHQDRRCGGQDATGEALACVHRDDSSGLAWDEARRIGANIAKSPQLAGAKRPNKSGQNKSGSNKSGPNKLGPKSRSKKIRHKQTGTKQIKTKQIMTKQIRVSYFCPLLLLNHSQVLFYLIRSETSGSSWGLS
jgi:hypothetical protein